MAGLLGDAQVIGALLQAGLAEDAIGVISPYRSQLNLLTERLASYPNIEVLGGKSREGGRENSGLARVNWRRKRLRMGGRMKRGEREGGGGGAGERVDGRAGRMISHPGTAAFCVVLCRSDSDGRQVPGPAKALRHHVVCTLQLQGQCTLFGLGPLDLAHGTRLRGI